MDRCIENVIEWINGDNKVSITASDRRLKTKIKKLAEKHPEVKILEENKDGSLFVHMPINYIRFNAPIVLTEEERARRAEILRMSKTA